MMNFGGPHNITPELTVCIGHVMNLTWYCFPQLLTDKVLDYVYSVWMILIISAAVVGMV